MFIKTLNFLKTKVGALQSWI